jgi:glycosyltransferase involved in cell wall biosynthesis
MKVLVVGPDRNDPGGVANYYNAVFPRLSGDGVEAHYLEIGSTHGSKSRLHILGDQLRFWKMLGRLKPDIVHLNPSLDMRSFLRDGLFVFQAKLRGFKVLVFFRGWQESFERKVAGKLKWFFDRTYAKADRFIVLATSFSDRLVQWGINVPVELATTTVADELLDGFSIIEKAENIGTAEVVRLLYLARLERDKGVLELLDAVKLLLNRGVLVSLTIAGEGPMMTEVCDLVANLGEYRDRVRIAGYVRGHEKKEVLKTHHVYCFPTQYGEGMPNSVLEAMAFGMPVITCPVGGISDFFENNKMGVLLSKVEPGYMADAIESLIASHDYLAEISYYNYNYAQRRFLASNVAGTLQALYKDMYSGGHDSV